jgi:hypothetical protein
LIGRATFGGPGAWRNAVQVLRDCGGGIHSIYGRSICPKVFFDDQVIEIPCRHCLTTSPKTIAWVRATDRYNCAGCNGRIVVERDALLAAALAENLRLARQ